MRLFNSAHIEVFAGLVRRGAGLKTIRLTVRYGLIDMDRAGLCLVDTGVGPEVTRGERSAALRLYDSILRPKLIESQSPQAVLHELGASTADVRRVILTHFHADHVSSLRDFADAEIISCGDAARRGWPSRSPARVAPRAPRSTRARVAQTGCSATTPW